MTHDDIDQAVQALHDAQRSAFLMSMRLAAAGNNTAAADAQNRVRGVGSDIEATIERNPLAAVLTALSAGLLIGMISGARR